MEPGNEARPGGAAREALELAFRPQAASEDDRFDPISSSWEWKPAKVRLPLNGGPFCALPQTPDMCQELSLAVAVGTRVTSRPPQSSYYGGARLLAHHRLRFLRQIAQ
jgi:hypothetical protein